MKRVLFAISIIAGLASCTHKAGGKKFEVSGTITNNPAKVIYLEEIPMATMQRIVADSMVIGNFRIGFTFRLLHYFAHK